MSLRSMNDLSLVGHVEEARAGLHRAIDFGGEADLAAWARRWGESALERAEIAEGSESDDEVRVERDEYNDWKRALDAAQDTLEAVSKKLEAESLSEAETDAVAGMVEEAIAFLNEINL